MNTPVTETNLKFLRLIMSGDFDGFRREIVRLNDEQGLSVELYVNVLAVTSAMLLDFVEDPMNLLDEWWKYAQSS